MKHKRLTERMLQPIFQDKGEVQRVRSLWKLQVRMFYDERGHLPPFTEARRFYRQAKAWSATMAGRAEP